MSNDKRIQELFDVVQKKKAEIKSAERPSYLTNCSFGFEEDSSKRINLHVTNDLSQFVHILAFLNGRERDFNAAASLLGLDLEFKWMGYSRSDWESDIKTKINILQVSRKKKELEVLESRLDKIVSPELRAKMELEEIEKALQ